MTSPLLAYVNAKLLVSADQTINKTNGRIGVSGGITYLILAFMKRQQAPTTETGSKKVPKAQNDGTILPGAGGEYYLHRGYALQYAVVSNGYDLNDNVPSGLTFNNFTETPIWLLTGRNGYYRLGNDPVGYYTIENSSGMYGGIGIDELIYSEVGGIPLTLSVGDTQN